MFSRRCPDDLALNRITQVRRDHRPVRYDLTISNPTLCDLPYPDALLAPLADPAGLRYDPHPRGLLAARRAVAREHARHGAHVDPARVTLTASTSEAYAHLFKLLCDPGEAVLAPVPSYPLIEHLARAEGLTLYPYSLHADDGWRIDLAEIAAAPASVRAVIVVHPNNPTGSYVERDDAEALCRLCVERDWALIADQVFLDYVLTRDAPHDFAEVAGPLTFTLGGLSKSVGLPQVKLAWVVTTGPHEMVEAALDRLDLIADTYLSVSTPVQLAAPRLLEEGTVVRDAILQRVRRNLAALADALSPPSATTLLAPEGGWSAVLRFPAVLSEERLAIELLQRDSVAVQPGFFFDFPREGHAVVSLLPPAATFDAGLARLVKRIDSFI